MEAEKPAPKADGKLLRRLLAYALPYWRFILFALFFLLINSALQIAGPMVTQVAIDKYLAPNALRVPGWLEAYLPADRWDGLTAVSLLYFGALLAGTLAAVAQSYLMQRTGQLAMFDMRKRIFAHLQKLDVAYYDRNAVGKTLTRVTSDVDALNELFSSGVVALSGDILVIAFLLAAMIQTSPAMTALLLCVVPPILLVTNRFRKESQASNRKIRTAVAAINGSLQEHVSGMSVLQLFNREKKAAEGFDAANRDHVNAYRDAIHAYGWFYPVVEFLGVLILVVLLGYGGYRIQDGALTMGELIAFFQYGLRFFRPIQDLSEKYNILQTASAASERVFQLLDTEPAIVAPAAPEAFPEDSATIEFDRVWFAYKDEDWVLRDFSCRVEPGETVALVGHTGAGKTTITNLLLRFYDAQRGEIRIGGVDIRRFDPRQLRERFGAVMQDSFLFSGDIASNIHLGDPGIGPAAVREAARRVNLLDFVDSLEGGFAHEVKERGAGLSTGQKQLIGFALALARNPRFLILDEATASVDTDTELRVRAALDEMLSGRTSIVVAHRLSTIQRADRILVMHKGELRESGTHQELLTRRGIYWKLYQLQYKDQEAGSRA